MMKQILIAGVTTALLAGCVLEETPPASDLPPSCGAEALSGLVGQPRAVADAMRFDVPVRIIGPGQAVTMDYLANRLNITYNALGIIDRVYCG